MLSDLADSEGLAARGGVRAKKARRKKGNFYSGFLGGSVLVAFVRFALISSLGFFHTVSAMVYARACDSKLRNACW